MAQPEPQMNFCRRCGAKLQRKGESQYVCDQGHNIFINPVPGGVLILVNQANELLVLTRGRDPGKGALDAPGGLCEATETVEAAIAREVKEEIGFEPSDYGKPLFLFSRINTYEYDGEARLGLDCVFMARMKTGKQPLAGDDAAAAKWVPAAELNADDIFFPSVRAGYVQVLKQLQG